MVANGKITFWQPNFFSLEAMPFPNHKEYL
jgi:hypothetical protein